MSSSESSENNPDDEVKLSRVQRWRRKRRRVDATLSASPTSSEDYSDSEGPSSSSQRNAAEHQAADTSSPLASSAGAQSEDSDEADVTDESAAGGGSHSGSPGNLPAPVDEDFLNQSSSAESDSASVGGDQSSDEPETYSESDNDSEVEVETPLYDGAQITVQESLIAVLSLVATHRLSGSCLLDILKLLDIHCPPDNKCKTSLYTFKKFFSTTGQSQLVFHYYCSNCLYPLENDIVCDSCEGEFEKSFFIEYPLETQITNMCQRPGFYESLMYRFTRSKKAENNVEDIYDGFLYKQEFENDGFLSNPNHISLMWYTDGISIFKSSKQSLWPLYFNINELSYKERTRSENLILAGMWFGVTKPNPNLFLKPFHTSLQEFHDVGYNVTVPGKPAPVNIKGMLLCGVGDLPAKSLILRFKYYNGAFGCISCETPGAREPVGNATVQVYPYTPVLNLRNNADIPDLARQAVELQRRDPSASVTGVKGPTLLYRMVPDMVRGTAIDVMHGVFSGVSKMILELVVDSSLSQMPFSVYNMLDVVDNRLCQIKPPFFLQRGPRSIRHYLSMWHAQEHKYWFFYYSIVILLGIWEEEYLVHHCKLVSAVYLLSQRSIFPAQIDTAFQLLDSYVRDFQNLYGLRYLGMNVHQLLHLVKCVKDLGPLWVYSCFQFEDKNGRLARLAHGTRYAGLQISSSASVFLKLGLLIESLPAHSRARHYCERLRTAVKNVRIADEISPQIVAVGKYKKVSIADDIQCRNALQSSTGLVNGSLQYFCRLRAHGIMYTSTEYRTSGLRDSTHAKFVHENVPCLGKILRFAKWSICAPECNHHTEDCEVKYFCFAQLFERQPWFVNDLEDVNLTYLNRVSPTNTVVAIPVASLESVCFHMIIEGAEYLASPINNLEIE